MLDPESNVFPVLVGQCRCADARAGQIDAFVRRDRPSDDHVAIQMASTDLFNGQLDEAVIDEDPGARPHVSGQVRIGDGNFLNAGRRKRLMAKLSAGSRQPCLQPHGLVFTQYDPSIGDLADTDPRSLDILNDRDGSPTVVCRFANGLDGSGMRRVCAVGKVQAGGIHALFDQPDHCVQMIAGGPDRTDDFCFTHLSSSGIDKRSTEVQKMLHEPSILAGGDRSRRISEGACRLPQINSIS